MLPSENLAFFASLPICSSVILVIPPALVKLSLDFTRLSSNANTAFTTFPRSRAVTPIIAPGTPKFLLTAKVASPTLLTTLPYLDNPLSSPNNALVRPSNAILPFVVAVLLFSAAFAIIAAALSSLAVSAFSVPVILSLAALFSFREVFSALVSVLNCLSNSV